MIPAVTAFQIALEDPQTISFIRRNFLSPEKYPQISSRRWLSADNSASTWNIELLEKKFSSLQKKVDLINVIFLEVDASSGKITGRTYFANIMMNEYRVYLTRLSGSAVSKTF